MIFLSTYNIDYSGYKDLQNQVWISDPTLAYMYRQKFQLMADLTPNPMAQSTFPDRLESMSTSDDEMDLS